MRRAKTCKTTWSMAAKARMCRGSPSRSGCMPCAGRRGGGSTVSFAAPGERLELIHRTNRDVFVRGALHAAKWLKSKPGRYSMANVLEHEINPHAGHFEHIRLCIVRAELAFDRRTDRSGQTHGTVDRPDARGGTGRKDHAQPIPTTGGIAVFPGDFRAIGGGAWRRSGWCPRTVGEERWLRWPGISTGCAAHSVALGGAGRNAGGSISWA